MTTETQTTTTDLALPQAYADALKNAPEPTLCITPKPLLFENVGDEQRVYYLGQAAFEQTDHETGEVKIKPESLFTDGKNIYFSLSTVLVGDLARRGLPAGTPLLIRFVDARKNTGGKAATKFFDIFPLNVPPLDVDIYGPALQSMRILPPAPRSLLQPGQSMSLDQAEAVEFVNKDGAAVKLASIAGDGEKLVWLRDNSQNQRVREAAAILLDASQAAGESETVE